jgi:putative transposase
MFAAVQDYELFLVALHDALVKFQVSLHGYVLMTNHVHLVVTTGDAAGIGLVMQSVGRRYVYYFNRAYGRTGALFEGRYRAVAIENEAQWYTCMRYVEDNPVRAGMVTSAESYRWSSRSAHAYGSTNRLLSPHPLYLALGPDAQTRRAAWRDICGVPLADEQVESIRRAIRKASTLSRSVQGSDPGEGA